MLKLSFAIFFATLLGGCSTQNISTSPATNLKLVGDSVFVKVTGNDIDSKVLDRLTREIKGQLIIAGFDLDKETSKKIYLNVVVSVFTPGNAALRFTVGFGAGRGSLVYSAEYSDQAGKTLAKMEGQERFTGAEMNFELNYGAFTTWGGEDTATEVLIKEAGKHIIDLALKNEPK
jgi:hypothetical protein